MDKAIFKILDYIGKYVFETVVDFSSIINEIFRFKKGMSEDEFKKEKERIIRFLSGLTIANYLTHNGDYSALGYYTKERKKWCESGKI